VLEIIAVIFGLLSVWFAKNNNIMVFPAGIISVTIYMFITFSAKLYADTGINFYYLLMSIYGWVLWGSNNKKIKKNVSRVNNHELVISITLTLCFFFIIYYLLSFSDSDVAFFDSITTSLCLVAMLLMARRKIEHWVYWIIADIIYVPLYIYKDLPLTSFQFMVFLIIAISGYNSWKKIIDENNIHNRA